MGKLTLSAQRSECSFTLCANSSSVAWVCDVKKTSGLFNWQMVFGAQAVYAVTWMLFMSCLLVWEQVSTLFGQKNPAKPKH